MPVLISCFIIKDTFLRLVAPSLYSLNFCLVCQPIAAGIKEEKHVCFRYPNRLKTRMLWASLRGYIHTRFTQCLLILIRLGVWWYVRGHRWGGFSCKFENSCREGEYQLEHPWRKADFRGRKYTFRCTVYLSRTTSPVVSWAWLPSCGITAQVVRTSAIATRLSCLLRGS